MEQEKNKLLKNQTFLAMLGLGILVALGIIIYIVLKSIWNSIKDYPTITVAIITGFLSIVAIIIQRVWEKRYNKEQELRNKKLPVYQKMINEFSLFFYNDPSLKTKEEQEKFQENKINKLVKFVADNNGELITWASDEVLKEWSLYRKIALSKEDQGMKLMFQTEKLFYAIRKDLGHKNKNLLTGDILRFFVNDIDEVMEKTNKNIDKN